MLNNQRITALIKLLSAPIATGLAVAAVLLLLFPELRGTPTFAISDKSHSAQITDLSGPVSYSRAVVKAAPSVVNIYTRTVTRQGTYPLLNHPLFRRLYDQQQQRVRGSLGSGVIMDSRGFIVTSYHVVDRVDEILVLLYDGREVPASVVGTDPETDLAVLKITADNLQSIEIGSPNQAEIGDVVLAIGNPFGMGQTVTQGIVSATRRNGLNLSTFENYIQTDADINPGNSGGALVDARGKLLGINAAKINRNDSEGIGFAVPADEVQKVLASIISQGRVIRGWLGFEAHQITPSLARQLNINLSAGLLITGIANGGPAHIAGLLPGDIVTSINGVAVTDPHSSINQIAEIVPGEPIDLQIRRADKPVKITATAGLRPAVD